MIFVGERRSPLARRRGWRWEDGRLAAKQLFDALRAIGIDPTRQEFVNAFEPGSAKRLRSYWAMTRKPVVVGMGQLAQEWLIRRGIPHLPIVHPAARGAIRKKELYIEHVRSVLGEVA